MPPWVGVHPGIYHPGRCTPGIYHPGIPPWVYYHPATVHDRAGYGGTAAAVPHAGALGSNPRLCLGRGTSSLFGAKKCDVWYVSARRVTGSRYARTDKDWIDVGTPSSQAGLGGYPAQKGVIPARAGITRVSPLLGDTHPAPRLDGTLNPSSPGSLPARGASRTRRISEI